MIIKRIFVLLAALAWLAAAANALAQGLPSAKPEEIGLSSERLAVLTETLRANIAKGEIPGAVLLIARHGKVGYFESLGALDPQTKAAMTLFEDGKFNLDEPVGKYLPQLLKLQVAADNKPDPEADPSKITLVPASRPMSIQDLMRHTSGLTYVFFGDTPVKKLYVQAKLFDGDFTNADFVDRIAKLPLSYQPGTTWDYSHSTDVLGRVIEVVSGKSLLAYEKERILDPVGMTDTSFYVTDKAKQDRVAEPFANDRRIGEGAVFGDPRVAGKWESGGGGMVSTAIDYARFLQMLLNGGTLEGKRILGPKTIAYMTSDQLAGIAVPGPYYLPGPGYTFGLGFAVRRDAGVSAVNSSPGEYNWGGAGGTAFWVDPKEDMLVVFMMQSPSQRTHYRGLLRDMIYAAIEK